MKKTATLTGKFYSKPEVGRFSYAKTRRKITEKILNFVSKDDPNDKDETPDNIFVGVTGFDVDDDGFTLEIKVTSFKFNQESTGIEAEQVKLDILDELEEVFKIGGHTFDKEEAKKLSKEGILLIGYFTDFKDEDTD